MTKVISTITTSIDGYYAGPNDGPGKGLGEGGERLHYWVFGGPWSYDVEPAGEATGADKQFLDEAGARLGAVICGRSTYEAADHWGGENPWPVPLFVVTHRPEEEPPGAGFTFVPDFDTALERAKAAAGDRDITIMGGGELIRQAFRAGVIEEFTHSMAPVVLGGGKRLFEGFDESIDMEPIKTYSSPYATHVTYRVRPNQPPSSGTSASASPR
jgi:dihydrofolate reductase